MILSKSQFDALLKEVELSFQKYIHCPSQENEDHYLVMKNKHRKEVAESDLRLIIEWSKE
ncbi:MAG: hypothetical protein ACJAS1_002397 [Oleiphilaceae bacterium]|jgi:hypothetical protein